MTAGTVVVPTIGESPCVAEVLEALRHQEGAELRILCVGPAEVLAERRYEGGERVEVPSGTGFAAAANRGLRAAGSEVVGLLNDDAIPAADWWRRLARVLEERPAVGAVQGLNLDREGRRIDGAGIRWNRWWQAVQRHRGAPAEEARAQRSGPIDGASGTGVLFRREALEAVSGVEGRPFDEVLESWYEDVDLAARLLAVGFGSWIEAGTGLRHVGTASGAALGRRRWELLYGNRWLVLARHLGRGFGRQVPRIWLRDALDRLAALRDGDRERAAGIRAGRTRARALLPRYRHRGEPTLRPGGRPGRDG